MIKQTIAQILDKEMDRKDFLKALGIGIIATSGVAAALSSVQKQVTGTSPKMNMSGYSSSVYGGKTTN